MTGEPMSETEPHPLEKLLRRRIVIIDGAMGTTIRTYGMTEAHIRGERFKDATKDLLNNGDLFSLTQPDMICDIHRRFLEAGADIIETNTFGATSITQSEFFVDDPREHGGRKDPAFYQKVIDDTFLGDLAWEINEQFRAAVPRVGRPRRERRREAALRGGRHRPADRVPLQFARRGRRGFPCRHLRSGQDFVRAADPRAHRGRLRRPAGRDDLRLAQCQGGARGDRGGVRRRRKAPAHHDLGSGRSGRRDDDLGADRRSALERREAREADVDRSQLLPRPGSHVSVSLRALGEVERRHLLLSERRIAQPPFGDRLRSPPRRHGALPRRVRPGGAHQHRRRLLRQHSGAHRGHRQGAGRTPPARAARDEGDGRQGLRVRSLGGHRGAAPPAPVRLAALHAAARRLHDDRRAHQRRRLAEVRQARSRKGNTRKPSASRASRSRTARTSSTSAWTKE